MTNQEYRRLTLISMQKRSWRTTAEMANGNMLIPAGSKVEIVGKSGGLSLKGPKCPHCGVAIFIRKVSPCEVEEV